MSRNSEKTTVEIPSGILDICEDLLSYFRYYPSNAKLLAAFLEIGSRLKSPGLNPRTLIQEASQILESLKKEPGEHKEILDFLQSQYITRKSTVSIQKDDMVVFNVIVAAAQRLFDNSNSPLIQDFGDAFHGYPFAIRIPEFDRGQYFVDYLQPFIERWSGFLTKDEEQTLREWVGKDRTLPQRDRLGSAAKYAGKTLIKVTTDGVLRDGHRRVKAAIGANRTVSTIVVP